MDRFAELKALVAVVEAGGFSAASERLGLAKSAVSRRISDLEGRLGVRVFNRTTRRISLTDEGRALHERAVRLLEDLYEAEQSVSSPEAALRGRVRVAAPLTFGVHHLSPVINGFVAQHPGLVLDLDLNDRQVDLVNDGFDMAVRIGRLEDSSLVARRINTVRMVCVASPGYLERHGRPTDPARLEGHWGLRYTNLPRGFGWRFTAPDGVMVQADVPDRLTASNGDVLTRAAVDGLGISLAPRFIVYRHLQEGTLVPILEDYQLDEVGVYLVYPPGRYQSRRVRLLAEWLTDHLGGDQSWT
ncbi:MAG: LysR family transcriptional regulator [Gammaproteobacteria bacterium]